MPTPQMLQDELLHDPESLGYAAFVAAGNDSAVAALLNEKRFRGPVPIAEVASYCCVHGITGGVMALLEIPVGTDIAPGVPMTLQIKGMLHTVLTLIQLDYRLTTCDTDDAAFGAACGGLVGLGVMTTGQRDALVALGDNRRSRAEVLFGATVTANDVAAAFGRV